MSEFMRFYGGDQSTAGSVGLAALQRALDAGLTINEIRNRAAKENFGFGTEAQNFLDERPSNSFIAQYGGNEASMVEAGLQAVARAYGAGLTFDQIRKQAEQEGVTFGSNAQRLFGELDTSKSALTTSQKQLESALGQLALSRGELVSTLGQLDLSRGELATSQGQLEDLNKQQLAYQDALRRQESNFQSRLAQQQRSAEESRRQLMIQMQSAGREPAEVRMSQGQALRRAGATGYFGREGMRISGLNVPTSSALGIASTAAGGLKGSFA